MTAALCAVRDDDLDAESARDLTERIKTYATASYAAELLVAAYDGRVWVALGYASWEAWRVAEFGGEVLLPNREQVVSVLRRMREDGATYQEAASATGVSKGFAHKVSHDVTPLRGNDINTQPINPGAGTRRTDSLGRSRPTSYQRPRVPDVEPPRIAALVDPSMACAGYTMRREFMDRIKALERDLVDLANEDLSDDERNLLLRALDRVSHHLDGKG